MFYTYNKITNRKNCNVFLIRRYKHHKKYKLVFSKCNPGSWDNSRVEFPDNMIKDINQYNKLLDIFILIGQDVVYLINHKELDVMYRYFNKEHNDNESIIALINVRIHSILEWLLIKNTNRRHTINSDKKLAQLFFTTTPYNILIHQTEKLEIRNGLCRLRAIHKEKQEYIEIYNKTLNILFKDSERLKLHEIYQDIKS